MNVWVVSLSTFGGITPGASHYYAKLHGPNGSYDLDYVLDAETAAALDRADRRIRWKAALDYRWEPGSTCSRFLSREHAVEHAIVAFWLAADRDDVLVSGSVAVLDPQEPIAGNPGRLLTYRAFYDRAIAVDFYDGDAEERAEMERIYEEFRAWQDDATPTREETRP